MVIFIDESGIQKSIGYSSIAFVYVYFENKVNFEEELIQIEKYLGIKNFHWTNFGSKEGWRVREKFIKKIAKLSFTFKISLLQNPIHFSSAFETSLEQSIIESKIQEIVIDGKKSRRYEQKIKKILRSKGTSVKKIRTANDESSPGLRIADAIAGLYRSHFDNPTELTKKLIGKLENKKTTQRVGGQKTR